VAQKQKKASRGKKDKAAELFCEKWLYFLGLEHVHRYRRAAAGLTFSFAHDLFGAIDFQSLIPASFAPFARPRAMFRHCTMNGSATGVWLIQMTTQGGRTERRRKIEKIPWPLHCRIDLMTHEVVPDPAHRGRRLSYWRVEEFSLMPVDLSDFPSGRTWLDAFALPINAVAVEAHAKGRNAQKKAAKARKAKTKAKAKARK